VASPAILEMAKFEIDTSELPFLYFGSEPDGDGTPSYVATMGQAERPTCPECGAYLIWALPPGGNGKRTFQCFDCNRPDPLKSTNATGWLAGELGKPQIPKTK
jgi:hypothetical protein